MEKTIFDYNVSPKELRLLYISETSKDEYLKNTTLKGRLQDLYVLFKIRNDHEQASRIGLVLFNESFG